MSDQHSERSAAVSQPLGDYGSEQTVNLRSQRLRRAAEPEPVPDEADEQALADGEDGAEQADPYGVGADALAVAETSPSDDAAPHGQRGGLFADTDRDLSAAPATWGWRGRINAAIGTRLRVPDGAAELGHRADVHAVRQCTPGIITIASPKGGSGKTPSALMLAAAFGTYRPGVVVWDASEAAGTLADRAGTKSSAGVADVLAHAPRLASGSASAAEMSALLTRQDEGHEVLGTTLDGTHEHTEIGAAECAAIMAVLRRHRDLLLIDTGTNTYAPAWQWSVTHADELVIPVPLRPDAAKAAYLMCHRLRTEGYGDLVASARVLLTATPASSPALETDISESLFELGVTRFSRLPYDPVLASGDRLRASSVSPVTTRAFITLAAHVADDLAARSSGTALVDPATPIPDFDSGAGFSPRVVAPRRF